MVQGQTDENGIAIFTVEAGTYLVTASKVGFETKQVEITIFQDITLDIILEPTPPPPKYTLTVKLTDPLRTPLPSGIIDVDVR